MGSKKSKKILSLLAIFGLVIAVSVIGTLAYFSGEEHHTNTLTVGKNEISIEEEFDPDPLDEGENIYQKRVQIKNEESVPCYVRVFLDFSEGDAKDASTLSADGTSYYTFEQFKDHLPTKWVYANSGILSGYFYYTEALPVGASTDKLLESVKTTFASEVDVKDYELIVYAESVQTIDKDGNAFTGAVAYRDAWTEFLSRKEIDNEP